MLKIEFLSKALKHNHDSWMRNIIKKTTLSLYSQPTQKKKKNTGVWFQWYLCVCKYKTIILIKTQNGQVSKAAKNPNKSTTHEETKTAKVTNLSAKINSKILISNSNNHVTHHVKSPIYNINSTEEERRIVTWQARWRTKQKQE